MGPTEEDLEAAARKEENKKKRRAAKLAKEERSQGDDHRDREHREHRERDRERDRKKACSSSRWARTRRAQIFRFEAIQVHLKTRKDVRPPRTRR